MDYFYAQLLKKMENNLWQTKNLNKVVEKETPHDNNSIYACEELNRRIIASASSDYSIKLWEI